MDIMHKRGISVMLVLLMVLGGFSGLFVGGGKAHAFAGGSGTPNDPYQIATATDLDEVRNHLEAYFKLIRDIDLEEYDDWTPLGGEDGFQGNIDGNGYKIENITITNRDNNYFSGLFGYIRENGIINNISLENVNIKGGEFYYIGGLAGDNNGIIINSYVTGVVGGDVSLNNGMTGGLVGRNIGTIRNSHASVSVTGSSFVGGLVGINYGIISDSYATGTVAGGGISYENMLYTTYVGGFIGKNSGIIGSSYATGSVSGGNSYSFVGGFAGYSTETISNSYATGDVNSAGQDVGGFIGANIASIINSYTTGALSGTDTERKFVSSNYDGGSITNSFYVSNTIDQGASDKGVGKTIDEMQTQSTFTDEDWDFDSIWYMGPGQYPQLWTGNLTQGTDIGTTKLENAKGLEYSLDGGDNYTVITNSSLDNIKVNAGDEISVQLASNPSIRKTFTVALADIKAVAAPEAVLTVGTDPGTTMLTDVDDTMQFSVNGSLYKSITDTTEDNIAVSEDDWIEVRVEATELQPASAVQAIHVTAGDIKIVKVSAAITGVTPPVIGGTPVISLDTDEYLATITWSPEVGETFAAYTAYTATITLAPKNGYTLTGVDEDFFTVAGTVSPASNDADSGVITAVFPATAPAALANPVIEGVIVPEVGATPSASVIATDEYTGTIVWSPTAVKFAGSVGYTATITLVAKAGFTLAGVAEDFFTVAGTASPATNDANSGIITAIFPATAPAVISTPLITGVTAPVKGATPVTTTIVSTEYTATIAWLTSPVKFAASTSYTATITISPKAGFTLGGVAKNFFNVFGATTTTNDASSGVITAVFPATAALSSAATLTSTIGTVSVGNTVYETITSIPNGTTLAAFKTAITPAANATFAVYEADGTTLAAALATGYKVVVTAENGIAKVWYTVTVNAASSGSTPSGGNSTLPPTATPTPTPIPAKVTSTDGTLTLPVGKPGEVSLGNELTISIPANASNKELRLTLSKILDTQSLLTNKEVLASPVYEILKNFSENFTNPVTLTFAFNPASLNSKQKVVVFYYDEVKKIWVEVPGGKISGNNITVDVNHFTKYAVFAVDIVEEIPAKPVLSLSDITGYWAEANIKQAVSNGIVSGYPDGTFKPTATVTRAEFAVMLMNTLKLQGEGTALTFKDNAKIGTWAQKAVAQAVQAGIIKGYEDGTFRPNAEITRAEMAVLLANAHGQAVETNAVTDFADDKNIPTWAKGSVAFVKLAGIVQGRGNNQFAPQDHASRAEAVTVLLNLLAQKSK